MLTAPPTKRCTAMNSTSKELYRKFKIAETEIEENIMETDVQRNDFQLSCPVSSLSNLFNFYIVLKGRKNL